MKRKTCFFIGHRDAPSKILPLISKEVERHITEFGVSTFLVGGYGSFDAMASKAVIAAKQRHPDIELLRLIPYHPAERPVDVPDGFDGTLYPDGMESVPRRLAILRANRHAIDHAEYLIAYVWHPASNSLNLVEHARVREKRGLITITLLENPV